MERLDYGFENDEVNDQWSEFHGNTLNALLRFQVCMSMGDNDWPGSHWQLTEELSWGDMKQGEPASD